MKLFQLPKLSEKFFLLLTFIALAGSSYYFYTKYQKVQQLLQNPTEAAKEETKFILKKVGKLMDLPSDEEPTIATIIDIEKLKDQPFFAKAQNGDKVILYTNTRKAILFRPNENKILDVAPLNIGTQSATPQAPPLRVALYNGTEITGLTQTAEKNLKAKYADIDVVARESAQKTTYDKTIVVDLSGTKKQIAIALAAEFNGEVGNLPEAEVEPSSSADILVIVGKNYTGDQPTSP